MDKIIEIKGERELIQIDVTEFMTNKDKWETGDFIKCNIYFQKLECKFVSKDVVISYDAVKIFNHGLKQLVHYNEGDCFLNDENKVVSFRCIIGKSCPRSNAFSEDSLYELEFKFLYHKGSDISLRGYLYSNEELLQQTIQEINSLL